MIEKMRQIFKWKINYPHLSEMCREVYELSEKYEKDELDRLIIASKVFEKRFSSGDDILEYGVFEDLTLMEELRDLVIKTFGRHTYISLLIGSIYAEDGIVSFINHPWSSLMIFLHKNGLSITHKEGWIDYTRGNLENDKIMQFYLDLILTGLQINLDVIKGDGKSSEVVVVMMPTVPTRSIISSQLNSYSEFSDLAMSQIYQQSLTKKHSIDIESVVKFYEVLIELYDQKLNSLQPSLGKSEVIYRSAVREYIREILFYGIKSSSVSRLNDFVRPLMEYLAKRGYEGLLMDIPSKRLAVSGLSLDDKIDLLHDRMLELPNDPQWFESKLSDIAGDAYYYLYKLMIELRDPTNPKLSLRFLLQNMKDPIINFAGLIKHQAQLAAQKGKKLIISPYQMTREGLRNPNNPTTGNTQFLPDKSPIYGNNERFIVIDGSNPDTLQNFDQDFVLLLGGLLVDGQTLIVKEEGMDEHEMSFGFNIECGLLEPSEIIPASLAPSTVRNWNIPPTITTSTISIDDRNTLQAVYNLFLSKPLAFSVKYIDISLWRSSCNDVLSIHF